MNDKQCPSCGGNCGRTVKSGCMYDIPAERKARRTLLELQAVEIAQLKDELASCTADLSREVSVGNDYLMQITKLKAELAALKSQEPVAWMRPSEEGYDSVFRDHHTVVQCTGNDWIGWIPLYTSPTPTDRDAERLDFIDRMARQSRTGVSFDFVKKYAEDGRVMERGGYRVAWFHTLNDRHATIREAIDTAMQEGK